MLMPWAGHICISEGALNTGRQESEKEEKMDKSMDGFWVYNKPQLQIYPRNKHIHFFSNSKTVLKKTSMQSWNPKDNDAMEERLGLNNSVYFTAKFVTLEASGFHVTLQAMYVCDRMASYVFLGCSLVLPCCSWYMDCLYMLIHVHVHTFQESWGRLPLHMIMPYFHLFFFFFPPCIKL